MNRVHRVYGCFAAERCLAVLDSCYRVAVLVMGTMNLRRSALQIHLNTKKPYQAASDHRRPAPHLIRINSVFLSLFCFRQGFYS
jgi:hypothetical protein